MAVGSTGKVAMVAALCCVMFVIAQAKVVHVSWIPNFDHNGWPRLRTCRIGDVVVFVYKPGKINVVKVSKAGYDSCTAGAGARIHTTGMDHITLHKGSNYFISTYPDYCEHKGMKMEITAY